MAFSVFVKMPLHESSSSHPQQCYRIRYDIQFARRRPTAVTLECRGADGEGPSDASVIAMERRGDNPSGEMRLAFDRPCKAAFVLWLQEDATFNDAYNRIMAFPRLKDALTFISERLLTRRAFGPHGEQPDAANVDKIDKIVRILRHKRMVVFRRTRDVDRVSTVRVMIKKVPLALLAGKAAAVQLALDYTQVLSV